MRGRTEKGAPKKTVPELLRFESGETQGRRKEDFGLPPWRRGRAGGVQDIKGEKGLGTGRFYFLGKTQIGRRGEAESNHSGRSTSF